MIAAKIANLQHGQKKSDTENSVSQEEAAQTLNVSSDSLQFARKVIDKAQPEVVAAVEAMGNMLAGVNCVEAQQAFNRRSTDAPSLCGFPRIPLAGSLALCKPYSHFLARYFPGHDY